MTLRVIRDKARSKDRRRPYTVILDGYEVGELRRGETKDFPMTRGSHLLAVSVDFEHSSEWKVSAAGDDAVSFVCRSRGKRSDGRLDLFLADPDDLRAHVVSPEIEPDRDLTVRQRVLTRDGRVMAVWAHRSGYLRSLDPGAGSGGGDEIFVELAYYILVFPVLALLRWVRHRLLFRRGWSVGVVRKRRFLWPKKVLLERYRSEAEARSRAAAVLSEVENWPSRSSPPAPVRRGG